MEKRCDADTVVLGDVRVDHAVVSYKKLAEGRALELRDGSPAQRVLSKPLNPGLQVET